MKKTRRTAELEDEIKQLQMQVMVLEAQLACQPAWPVVVPSPDWAFPLYLSPWAWQFTYSANTGSAFVSMERPRSEPGRMT